MKKKIKEFAKKLNIEFLGFTQTENKSVIVCLFPYFNGYAENSNISVYTYSKDYHLVVKDYLLKIAEFIKTEQKDFSYEAYSDVSPYNDILLAYNAGLGVIGKNKLLINEKYGSYVFIGYIVSNNLKFENDSPVQGSCLNCGICKEKCPSKALTTNNFDTCLSNITQKKGELNDFEIDLIVKNNTVFGCDICQKFCPMNKEEITPIEEFKENIVTELKKDDFLNLSNREFKERYSGKAFSWRGKNVLIRNLTYIEDNLNNQPK